MMSSKAKMGSHTRLSTYLVENMKTSKPESDRDSGFSDGSSGYLSAVDQMDSEDGGRQGNQATSQVAVMTGSYPNISPMIIMNNVVLNQPNTSTSALKPWGFQPAVEMLPQPQVVFFQPVVSNGNSTSQKSVPDKRRKSRKYLPILKSYPKIAPHPGESLSEKGGSSSSGQSSLASSQERRHRHRLRRKAQPVRPASAAADPTVPALSSASPPARPVSPGRCGLLPAPVTFGSARPADGLEPAPSQPPPASPAPVNETNALVPWDWPTEPAGHGDGSFLDALADGQSKQQRFCNTYNILHRSGLLGITLRTKELIRQNRRAQGQLELLKQHTSLFVEAMCSDDPHVWTRLQLTMMESSPAGAEEQESREMGTQGALP